MPKKKGLVKAMRSLHPPTYLFLPNLNHFPGPVPVPYGESLSLSRAFAIRRVTFRPIKSIMLPLAEPRETMREIGGWGDEVTETVTATEWWQTLNMTHK